MLVKRIQSNMTGWMRDPQWETLSLGKEKWCFLNQDRLLRPTQIHYTNAVAESARDNLP